MYLQLQGHTLGAGISSMFGGGSNNNHVEQQEQQQYQPMQQPMQQQQQMSGGVCEPDQKVSLVDWISFWCELSVCILLSGFHELFGKQLQ